ncbi:hypothetical protein GY45DRAFT_765944 [Cubamyces sp. BRFM 1775]|nr:hypothetical protein GY45DRAFT_765944 [Cubamyces sp. BRFM 1775]
MSPSLATHQPRPECNTYPRPCPSAVGLRWALSDRQTGAPHRPPPLSHPRVAAARQALNGAPPFTPTSEDVDVPAPSVGPSPSSADGDPPPLTRSRQPLSLGRPSRPSESGARRRRDVPLARLPVSSLHSICLLRILPLLQPSARPGPPSANHSMYIPPRSLSSHS